MSDNTEIIREARERLKAALDWEEGARRRAKEDYKFVNADADNGYQWPVDMLRARELDRKPSLTINKTRQHCLQIINDARQNQVEIRVDPVGNNATYESAQCMQDLIRHIEYQSQAQDVYINAVEFQVTTGIGYWRVLTDYVDDDSFDQEIYLRRIKDPYMVALDPDINEFDGSDARFGFIYEDLPEELFQKRYPKFKDRASQSALNIGRDDSVPDKHVRICEYYRRSEKSDTLYLVNGETISRDKLGTDIAARLEKEEGVEKRHILKSEVEWFLIIGDEIAERRDWLGQFIPIVRVIGEETIIDGKLDRKGHVRALKDPQRMYNYWSSAAVEFGALQTKVPWVLPLEAVSGVEQYWANANTTNYSYLPYRSKDETGNPLAPPQRAQPPVAAQAFLAGMTTAGNELMMASGQYQSQMGEQSNERTGIAIQERQRQGDNATYHFIANLASAIRYTGRILIDLIPHIYDTKRVIQIMQEDGTQTSIQINPEIGGPSQEQQVDEDEVVRMLNPAVGRYQVRSDVGPAFATRRQEAFNAMVQIMSANPDLLNKAGDLLMRAADFPMAEELAERLKPPSIDPAVQQAQAQIQDLQQKLADALQQLAEQHVKHTGSEQQKEIDVYKAQTDRMNAIGKFDPAEFIPIIRQLVHEAIQTPMAPVLNAADQTLDAEVMPQTTPPGAIPGQPSQEGFSQ